MRCEPHWRSRPADRDSLKLHIHQAQRDPDRGGTGDRERVAGEPGQKSPQNGCDDEAEQHEIMRTKNQIEAVMAGMQKRAANFDDV